MIRPAKNVDIPRLVELVQEMWKKSSYVDVVEIDEVATHRLFAQFIQRNNFTNDGGTLVMVSEKNGKVEGFFVGLLDRVYHVSKQLMAVDVFLYLTDEAPRIDANNLIDAYLSWATHNPKVVEVKASWTDAIVGADRIEKLYGRKGFRKCGAIYQRIEREPQRSATEALEEMLK